MRSLNLGPAHEHEHGHEEDEHAGHDHRGVRRRGRSSHEGHKGNTTWDQVPTHRKNTYFQVCTVGEVTK